MVRSDLPSAGLVEQRRQLRALLDRHSELAYAMTEYCVLGPGGRGRDLGMDTALKVARVIHCDLVIAGAASWQWWLAVSPCDYKDGLVYVDQQVRDGTHCESKTLWALGNYSRFVRPGMVRIGVERSDRAADEQIVEGLMVSSFLDSTRDVIVAVVVNLAHAEVAVKLAVAGHRVDAWIPYLTDEASDLEPRPVLAGEHAMDVPPRSVVTLVGRISRRSERS